MEGLFFWRDYAYSAYDSQAQIAVVVPRVQADLKTMSAHGRFFGMSVIVAVVAENTAQGISIQICLTKICDQMTAVFEI